MLITHVQRCPSQAVHHGESFLFQKFVSGNRMISFINSHLWSETADSLFIAKVDL